MNRLNSHSEYASASCVPHVSRNGRTNRSGRSRRITGSTLLFIFMLSLCGCGATSKDQAAASSTTSNSYDAAYKEEFAISDSIAQDSPAEMAIEESDAGGAWQSSDFVSESSAKRVYTGNVDLQATDFNETLQKVRQLTTDSSGFIQDENVSGFQDSRMYANLIIRIPTDQFDSFIAALETAGNLISQSKSSENITKNYYDVQARIESLQKERDRLNELVEKAESVSDLVEVESRLSELESELQSWQQDLSSMDLDLDYSTIYVNISQVQVYTNESYSPWNRIGSALKDTWVVFANGFGEFLIFVIYQIPWMLVVLAVVLLIYFGIKKYRPEGILRKHKGRKSAVQSAEKEQPPRFNPSNQQEKSDTEQD